MSDMIYNFIDFIFTIIDFMIFFHLLTNKLTSNLSKKKQIFLYFVAYIFEFFAETSSKILSGIPLKIPFWLLFTLQCHLVSDKVGNFHGNKALVTFL